MFASHFPIDEVQNEAEIRGSTPVSANDWCKNTTPVAVLIEFALYWASLILLRAMQLRVELPCTIAVLFVNIFLPFETGPEGPELEDFFSRFLILYSSFSSLLVLLVVRFSSSFLSPVSSALKADATIVVHKIAHPSPQHT